MSFAARALVTPAARAAATRRAYSNAAAEEQKSGGGGFGLLLALAAVGGGAYLYSQGYLDEFMVRGKGRRRQEEETSNVWLPDASRMRLRLCFARCAPARPACLQRDTTG